MIQTSLHLRNEGKVTTEIVTRDRADAERWGARYVVTKVLAEGGIVDEPRLVIFSDPQQAIELGRALVAAGQQAQRENDVEAATRAALETAVPK